MALSRKIGDVLLFILVAAFSNHAKAMEASGMGKPPAHGHFPKGHFHHGVDLHATQQEFLSHSDEDGECHHGCCKSAACHLLPLTQPAPVMRPPPKTFLATGNKFDTPSPKPEGRPAKSIWLLYYRFVRTLITTQSSNSIVTSRM